jgi:hypothetical protein
VAMERCYGGRGVGMEGGGASKEGKKKKKKK